MDLLNLGLPVQVYVVQERHQLLVRLNHVLVFHKQSLLRLILILACMELTLLQAFNLPEKVLEGQNGLDFIDAHIISAEAELRVKLELLNEQFSEQGRLAETQLVPQFVYFFYVVLLDQIL